MEAPVDTALDEAKRKAGGITGLAKAIGNITPQAVSQWKRVPADRAIEVEMVTGVSRHALRPDVFGPVSQEGAAA